MVRDNTDVQRSLLRLHKSCLATEVIFYLSVFWLDFAL